MVYLMQDQKAEQITKILVENVIPSFEVPEALLSDWGSYI